MSEEKIKLSALLDAFLDFRANAGDVEYYKKAEDLLQKVIVKEKMFLLAFYRRVATMYTEIYRRNLIFF